MVRYSAISMDKPEPTTNRNGVRWLIVFSVFVLPHILISLPGVSKFQSRPLTLGLLFIASSIGLCWYGLNPRSRILGPGALLNQPEYDAVRPKWVVGGRLLFIVLGIALFANFGIPFAAASVRVAKGQKPVEVTGMIVRNGSGPWFVLQSVTLSRDGGKYQVFYSLAPLRVGDTYELETLPGSNLVLDFHRLS
jgi:hypothetical protein